MTTPAMTLRLVLLWPPMVVDWKNARLRKPATPGEHARDDVDLDQVQVDVHADAAAGLGVGADGVGVHAEPGPVQHDDADDDDHGGDDRQVRDLPEDVAEADVVDQHGRHVAQVDALGDDLGQAERHAQRARG